MTDQHLIDALHRANRELRMTTPVDDILARARTLRRRRVPLVAAGLMVVVASTVTLAATLASSHTAAAWAVSTDGTGTVTVTVSELRDSSGLQLALARHGVRAIVQFNGSGCANHQAYQPIPDNGQRMQAVIDRLRNSTGGMAFAIHPAAIPAGTQLDIALDYSPTDQAHPSSEALRLVPLHHPSCANPPSILPSSAPAPR